jgi:hypothetical protein
LLVEALLIVLLLPSAAVVLSVVLLLSLLVLRDDARILYSDLTDTGDAVILLLLLLAVELLIAGTRAVSFSVQSLLDVHTNRVCCNACVVGVVVNGKLLASEVYVASIHVIDSLCDYSNTSATHITNNINMMACCQFIAFQCIRGYVLLHIDLSRQRTATNAATLI